jgi:hypothetical protein
MGPKTELGGVKAGFFRPAYQVGIAGVVKIAPIAPAPSQTTILMISLAMSAQLMCSNSLESLLRVIDTCAA